MPISGHAHTHAHTLHKSIKTTKYMPSRPGLVVHAFYPSTQEVEAGRSV